MRFKLPESIVSIQVEGSVEVTPEHERWADDAHGIPRRQHSFEDGRDGIRRTVNVSLPGDGFIHIDAPGLTMATSSMQGEFRAVVLKPSPPKSARANRPPTRHR